MVSELPHRVPGAATQCRFMVQDETAEVCAVLQAFMRCIHICLCPQDRAVWHSTGFSTCSRDSTPGGLWVSYGAQELSKLYTGLCGCFSKSHKTPKCQILDLGIRRTGIGPSDASKWQPVILGRWLNGLPPPLQPHSSLPSLSSPIQHVS